MTSSGGRSDDDATKVVFTNTDRGQTVIVPDRAGATVMVPANAAGSQSSTPFDPVVGWLVVVEGPGRGQFRSIHYGLNAIGRGQDLRISIDFGDQRISREPHAFVVYDERQRNFFVRDNGKSNIVRLNGNAVLTPTQIRDRDTISIGETTLMFVPLCDQDFDWVAGNAPTTA
ncbi:MAG TPA: FHA domain-containing protein [Hyphomicrobiaceae bacterium]|jgi:pSer/pThr/pTyr-binding forkhead associated (FHA) protein|nr:FHA domain-containing protein [Hyphomicrobiaceae bacterium]